MITLLSAVLLLRFPLQSDTTAGGVFARTVEHGPGQPAARNDAFLAHHGRSVADTRAACHRRLGNVPIEPRLLRRLVWSCSPASAGPPSRRGRRGNRRAAPQIWIEHGGGTARMATTGATSASWTGTHTHPVNNSMGERSTSTSIPSQASLSNARNAATSISSSKTPRGPSVSSSTMVKVEG